MQKLPPVHTQSKTMKGFNIKKNGSFLDKFNQSPGDKLKFTPPKHFSHVATNLNGSIGSMAKTRLKLKKFFD